MKFTKLELSLIIESLASSIEKGEEILKSCEAWCNKKSISEEEQSIKDETKQILIENIEEERKLKEKVSKMWDEA